MTRSIRSASLKHCATALILGLAMTSVAQTAAADSRARGPRQVEVKFGDLDLNQETGAATLLVRLSKAAKSVCNFAPPGPFNLDQENIPAACRRDALAKAVADVNHPVLTAMYQSKRGNPGVRLASR